MKYTIDRVQIPLTRAVLRSSQPAGRPMALGQEQRLTLSVVVESELSLTQREVDALGDSIYRNLVKRKRRHRRQARWRSTLARCLARVRVDATTPTLAQPSRDEPESVTLGRAGSHGESADDSPRFDPTVAESFYQNLGRWKGPLAAPDVQAATEKFWLGSGQEGATWLVQRLRTETHVDPLNAAGSYLADLGQTAVGPILAALDGSPPPDQASALLDALGWMAEKPNRPRLDPAPAELILARALQNDNPDVRESAARAILLIPPARAADWLKLRLSAEQDDDVRSTIREGLDLLAVGA